MVDRLNAVMSEGFEILSTSFFLMMQQMLCLLWQQQLITVLLSGRVMSRKMKAHRSGLRNWFNFLIQTMMIMKKDKKGEREMDLKPFVYELKVRKRGGSCSFMKVSAGSAANIKPELVLMHIMLL